MSPVDTAPWRLRTELGSGTGGVVFEAVREDGRRGALKRGRPGGEARFARERELLGRGLHPAFPALLDPGGEGWFVMELVQGRAAAGLARPVPAAAVARLGADLLEALAALHAAGVVHRDVALRNLVVEATGRLRILDLGAAAVAGAPALTAEGAVVGTADRASAGESGPGLDLFAAGGVLLDLLAGGDGGEVAELAHRLRDPDPARRPPARAVAAELARRAERGWAPTGTAPASAEAPPPTPPPDRLGRYVVREVIGRGGMGVVYRGWDPELARAVALKTHVTGDPRRFEREARAVAAIDHPGVVKVLDAGHEGQVAWIALEFVAGETLERRLERERVAPTQAVAWVADVAEGLARAHALGLVHRDVKPSNVLVDEAGRARLTDFGLARAVATAPDVTRAGVMIGTPRYMSPEQAEGQPVGPQTDVYALGLVLFEALTGRAAWNGSDPLRLLALRVTAPSPTVPSEVTPELRRVLRKAIAARPTDRYADAAGLAADLRRWQRGDPVRAEAVPLRRELAAWLHRNRRPVAAAALGVSAVLAVGTAVGAGTSYAARRARAAREAAADVAWGRAAARLEDLRSAGRADEAAALFSATVADPMLAGTAALPRAWLAEADQRASALAFDDAVRAAAQAWLASPADTRGDVLVAMADALAAAGRWEARTRVADLLEREVPARATEPDGRRLVRDRDAWRRRPVARGDTPLDQVLARLGHATRLARWDGGSLQVVPDATASMGPGVGWLWDEHAATPVRGPGLEPDGPPLEGPAFLAAGGRTRGPGHATHGWFGPALDLSLGDDRVRADGGRVVRIGPDGEVTDLDPWGGQGSSVGSIALFDGDGDGAWELAVTRFGWGLQSTRLLDLSTGETRAVLPVGSGSLAVVRVGARDWLAAAPLRYYRSAVQFPGPDPRPHRGVHLFDPADPAAPRWSFDGVNGCALTSEDLDLDGRADLLGTCDEGVFLALQGPDGRFDATLIGGFRLDGTLDADADGAPDLVVGDERGRRWLLGAGADRPEPLSDPDTATDPDPSVQAALDLDRIGLHAEALDRLDAVAVMTAGTPVALRARLLAAERAVGAESERRFRALEGLVDDVELSARAARAAAADHRLPEALAWADRVPTGLLPEVGAWRRSSTAPTLRWTLPDGLDEGFVVSAPDLLRARPDGLVLDAADEREVWRLPVRVVDEEVAFSVEGTIERLEWAGGWSLSLETKDGRSLGALRTRGTGGGRSVLAGLRCSLPVDAQERVLGDTPTPRTTGTFWWVRTRTEARCGLDHTVSDPWRAPLEALPEGPTDGWLVLRTHAEGGTPRTTLRLTALELRGAERRPLPASPVADHPAARVAALDEAGRTDDARASLRAWWQTGAATSGFVRTRPHWLPWLPPEAAAAAVEQAWPQLYQHVGDPDVDSILAQLGRSGTGADVPPGERAERSATIALALKDTDAARHHAAAAWIDALATPEPPARHRALAHVLPVVLGQDLDRGDRPQAEAHLAEALRATPWPELLAAEVRQSPDLGALAR